MSKILCLDTATDICTVSVIENNEILAFKDSKEERSHSVQLAVFIQEVLEKAQLTTNDLAAVAISKGPGSYTGLRIGVSMAKGLCYGLQIPLIAISTLQAMCFGMDKVARKEFGLKDFLYAPMLDARRMEVYTAIYSADKEALKDVHAEILNEGSYNSFLDEKPVLFFGNGAGKYKDMVRHKNAFFYDGYIHSSTYMTVLATQSFEQKNFEDVAYFEPYYLKDFIATTPKKSILFPNNP